MVEEALSQWCTTDGLEHGILLFYHLADKAIIGAVMWDLFELTLHQFVCLDGPQGPLFAYANERSGDILLCQWGKEPPPFVPFVTDETNPKMKRWLQMISKGSQNLLGVYRQHGATYAHDDPWPGFIEADDPRLLLDWMPSFHGASEDALVQLETRIGAPLPEDYRLFLSIANGWQYFHGHPAYSVYDLFPADEVKLTREDDTLFTKLGDHQQSAMGQLLKHTLIIGRALGEDLFILLDLLPPHQVYEFSPPPKMGIEEHKQLDRFLAMAFFQDDHKRFFPDGMA